MISRAQFDIEAASACASFAEKAEAIIDGILRDIMKRGERGCSISGDHFRGIPHDVLMQVLEQYRRQGWKADYTSDQRDGDYVILR